MPDQDYKYPLLQGLLYDTPLMIAPRKADILHSVLQGYAAGGTPPVIDAIAFRKNEQGRGYAITTGGIAVLSVIGSLVHRGALLDALSGLTSYNRLTAQLRKAEKDPDVKGIFLDIDSPGGAVAGLFDLTAEIQRINTTKPVWSISNENMFSAAYAIGTATSKLFAPQTGMVGSIGVIMMHLDESKRDQQQGRKYTPIYAGYHKIDGSTHAPLSDQARNTYQHIVDQNYDIFTSHVAATRDLDQQAIIDTQAQIYTAQDALDIKLIDQIATHDDALAQLEHSVSPTVSSTVSLPLASASTTKEVTTMSQDTQPDGAQAITQADLDAARQAGKEEGLKAGAEAEKTRIDAILNLESAKGRIDATLAAAIENNLDAAAADKFLSALPAQASNNFAAAMAAVGNPDVAADESDTDESTDAQLAAQVVALVQR